MKAASASALFWLLMVMLFCSSNGGPLSATVAYGVCQTGCNQVAVACFAAGSSIFGFHTFGLGVLPVIASCRVALGSCMSACASVTLVAAGAAVP